MSPVFLYVLIFLMVAFWSGNYIVGKIALREFSPLMLAGLRIGFAGVTMLPIYAWERRSAHAQAPGREHIVRLLVLGLFGVTLNQLFFIIGLSGTSVAHSSIIIGLTPILVLILARLRGLERITPAKATGMAIALAGVGVLRIFEPTSASGATALGDFFTFLTGLCFAIFTVFGKEETRLHSSITVNTFAYVGGGVALAPVTFWEASRHSVAHISTAAWMSALYMALFSSVIAYLIYYYALTRISASRVSAFSYLQPVFATAMGVALLGEHLSASVIAGGLVILAGVYLAERG